MIAGRCAFLALALATGCAERALGLDEASPPTRDLGRDAATPVCEAADPPVMLADDVDPFTETLTLYDESVLYANRLGKLVLVPVRGGTQTQFAPEGGSRWYHDTRTITFVYRPTGCASPDCNSLREVDFFSRTITTLVATGVGPPLAVVSDDFDAVVLSHQPSAIGAQFWLHRYHRSTGAWSALRAVVAPGQHLALRDRVLEFIDEGALIRRDLKNDTEQIIPAPDAVGWFGLRRSGGSLGLSTRDGRLFVSPRDGDPPRQLTSDLISPGTLAMDDRDVVTTGWNTDARVLAVRRAGGPVRLLAQGEADSRAIALDDTCVYFTTGAGAPTNAPQRLYRVPREP